MVVFSVERFVAVYFPITRKLLISTTKKKCSVASLIAFSLFAYAINLATIGSENQQSIRECVPTSKWMNITKYMTLADTFATIFVPFILISIINTLIAGKLLRDSMFSQADATSFKSTNTLREKVNSRASLVLLSISTSFIVLNFPLALDKMLYFFNTKLIYFAPSESLLDELHAESNFSTLFVANNSSLPNHTPSDEFYAVGPPPLEYLLNKLAAKVHYLNFVLNFFLYSLNGAKFRQAVVRLFSCK